MLKINRMTLKLMIKNQKNKIKMSVFFVLLNALFLTTISYAQNKDTQALNTMINIWHKAAADANAQIFFDFMADDCIYIGTDPTEYWTKKEFVKFAKPYFDRGKAWHFKPIERHIYFSRNHKTAWFDETLNTWMGLCRSSGVLKKQKKQWKIVHYQLSVTVPNDKIKDFIQLMEPGAIQHNE